MAKKPVYYSDALRDIICDRLSNGESLRQICRDKDMPSVGAFLRWVSENKELEEHYARARDAQADFYVDEIISIVDECDDVQKARLQMDARKWTAGRMKPQKYGDSVNLKHSGDKTNPVVVSWANEQDSNSIQSEDGTEDAS